MNSLPTIDSNLASQDLSIHMKKKEFAEFVLNFLGKKEVLSFERNATFRLNHNDIEQFHYLLSAKIQKEQNVIIEHFSVDISYNDGTKRIISGIEALNKFQETRFVYPVSVTLTWNIIVNFPNSETIENQVVELSFLSNNFDEKKKLYFFIKHEHYHLEGKVILNISHTNQAWGIEVLNLLQNKINSCCNSNPWPLSISIHLKKLINFKTISLWLIVIFSATVIYIINVLDSSRDSDSNELYVLAEQFKDSGDQEIQLSLLASQRMNSDDVKKVSEKLIKTVKLKDALNQISETKKKKSAILDNGLNRMVATLLLLIGIYVYSSYAIKYYGSNCYIFLTERSKKMFEDEIANRSKVVFYSFTFFIVTIFTGLITSYIWELI